MVNPIDTMVGETLDMSHFLHGRDPYQLYNELFNIFQETDNPIGFFYRFQKLDHQKIGLHIVPSSNLREDLLDLYADLAANDPRLLESYQECLQRVGTLHSEMSAYLKVLEKTGMSLFVTGDVSHNDLISHLFHKKIFQWNHDGLYPLHGRPSCWALNAEEFFQLSFSPITHRTLAVYLGPLGDPEVFQDCFIQMKPFLERELGLILHKDQQGSLFVMNDFCDQRHHFLKDIFIEGRFPLEPQLLTFMQAFIPHEMMALLRETALIRGFWKMLQTKIFFH
jgi:hypothetical protein